MKDKIKIIFVDPCAGIIPGLGLAYLAGALKEKFGSKIEAKILQSRFEENLLKSIIREKADIIGYTSFSHVMSYLYNLIKEVSRYSSALQIIGGPHINALPEDLPAEIQIGVWGAGEETICELIAIYQKKGELPISDLKKVRGIIFRDNGKLFITERRPAIADFDKMPLPSRDLLNIKGFFPIKKGPFPLKFFRGSGIMTSRGCPFNCAFCQDSAFTKHQAHSPERALAEIEELINKYKVNYVEIMDDQFACDVERLEKIVLGIEKKGLNKKAVFYCYIRADQASDRVLSLLKRMNVRVVFIGFESGSDRILKYLKQETCSVEKNQRAFDICQRYGIYVYGSFIFGSPYETIEDMEQTYQFIKKNKMALVEVQALTPLPGTKVWEYAEKRGLVSRKMDWDTLFLRIRGDGKNRPWLCENVSWDEFYKFYKTKVLPLTWHYQQIVKDFNFSDLLRPIFLKSFLENPRFYLSMAKHTLRERIFKH